MQGRLRELRDSRRMTQSVMGDAIGASQQNISKYEKDICSMPVDLVVRIADFFNVTTDYLLGRLDEKRGKNEQARINEKLDEYEDLIETYSGLEKRDQEVVRAMMEEMKKRALERK